MTNENTIKTMVSAGCEQITGNFVEAIHSSGGRLTESAQKKLGIDDPADSWNSESIGINRNQLGSGKDHRRS